jgi:hypothetical protein
MLGEANVSVKAMGNVVMFGSCVLTIWGVGMEGNAHYGLDDSMAENDWWFYPVGGGDMQRVNLHTFYRLGKNLQRVRDVRVNDTSISAFTPLIIVNWTFEAFIKASMDMAFPLSQNEAVRLHAVVSDAVKGKHVSQETAKELNRRIDDFETVFAREAQRVSVFTVTPKGIYDIEKLINEGENKFPPELLAVMPPNVIEDVQEASRCMAFERGTACAFHICRATEGLMRAYYKKLTGDDWPPPPPKPPMRKEWAVLVDQLAVEGAPRKIIERLKELRDDRNSYAHPDVTVPIDEAPIVYETCTFAMFYIAKEMM